MPMARPTSAGSSPPGYLRASSANTGSTRNRPSMRSAKISARLMLERRSSGVLAVAGVERVGEGVWGGTVMSDTLKRGRLAQGAEAAQAIKRLIVRDPRAAHLGGAPMECPASLSWWVFLLFWRAPHCEPFPPPTS